MSEVSGVHELRSVRVVLLSDGVQLSLDALRLAGGRYVRLDAASPPMARTSLRLLSSIFSSSLVKDPFFQCSVGCKKEREVRKGHLLRMRCVRDGGEGPG